MGNNKSDIPCFFASANSFCISTLFVVAVFLTFYAHAEDIHKCKGADGKTVIQDTPCSGEKTSTVINSQSQNRNYDRGSSYVGRSEVSKKKCQDLYAIAKKSPKCIDTINAEMYTVDHAGLVKTYYRSRSNIRKACEPDESELKPLYCTPEDGFYEVHSMDMWAGIPDSPGSYYVVTMAGRTCRSIRQTHYWQKCEGIDFRYR